MVVRLISVRDRVDTTSAVGQNLAMKRVLCSLGVVMLVCGAATAGEPIEVRSEAQQLLLRITSLEHPEPLNRLHGLDLILTLADGTPVSAASVALSGQHRYALNPLPTAPQVRPADGPGRYKVEGLRFHIAGEWRLLFTVESQQIRDRISLDLVVK